MGSIHFKRPHCQAKPGEAVRERHLRGLETAERPAPEPRRLGQGVHGHENEILTRIAELRSKVSAAPESGQIKGGTEISSLPARLQVAVENYPELKANGQSMHLQGQIGEMENELQAIRRTYNAAVTDYNNSVEMFPSSVIASWRRHERRELVEFPEGGMKEVKVGELFGQDYGTGCHG